MPDALTNDPVIQKLVAWGRERADVRAMLLTSTRAVPGAKVDALSDYDVILVARAVEPFTEDRRWIGDFGAVLVAYWDPVGSEPVTGCLKTGNVVQYDGAMKIDFTVWPPEAVAKLSALPQLPPELDAGYAVLLDKDGLTPGLGAPTSTGYIPAVPDEATYLTLVNDFFIGVPYVAKCLLRDELLPAKWCLDYDMRYVYLLPMLEWRMECDHGWRAAPGNNGKGLKRLLPVETWTELEGTFSAAGIEENWDALFRMIALFRRIGREVGANLGYAYPEDLDRRVTGHARRMRNGDFGLPCPTDINTRPGCEPGIPACAPGRPGR
jgi:aminoglycoside 6-adenylyltransferase